MYELSCDRIRPALARLHDIPVEAPASRRRRFPPLPGRPPMLCAGCTHRTSYYAVKIVADGKDTYYASDIGCYTLGLLPPLETTDSFLCMGSSVTMACGASINSAQKHVAFIGDSTFYHSGITGLVNAVHNRHNLLLVVLDNSTTAMTGHQPHPSNETGARKAARRGPRQTIVRGCGVEDVQVVDPEDLKNTIDRGADAYDRDGVRVIISAPSLPAVQQTHHQGQDEETGLHRRSRSLQVLRVRRITKAAACPSSRRMNCCAAARRSSTPTAIPWPSRRKVLRASSRRPRARTPAPPTSALPATWRWPGPASTTKRWRSSANRCPSRASSDASATGRANASACATTTTKRCPSTR
jgi:TPP-dependent indolepyruvate ferredoxin oxidoreductase alpha subunit